MLFSSALRYLTGSETKDDVPPGISTPGSPGKFSAIGIAQPWPGNTFLCRIPESHPTLTGLRGLQEAIKASPFAAFFTFLPPASFHMTVLGGVSPVFEGRKIWTDPPPLSRDAATAKLQDQVKDLALPQKFHLQVQGLFALQSLRLEGKTAQETAKLDKARHALAQATAKPLKSHAKYAFHITLAYQLRWVSEDLARQMIAFADQLTQDHKGQIGPIELGPIELCNFETMHRFDPVLALA